MKYRSLGNTGLRVSEIGLGCEGFVGKSDVFTGKLLNRAIECGVNIMDLYSPEPKLRSAVGKALEGRREKFILESHLCAIWKNGQYKASRDIREVRPAFEDMLERYRTDYIDIGMIHYVDSVETWDKIAEGDIMKFALEMKKAGKIRHIGLSSHNPKVALKAVRSGLIEVLLFSINPCYDLQPAGEDVEELWADKNYEKNLINMDPDRENFTRHV